MALLTPKEDGFRAPAEWEPHSACLIGWPWRKNVWPGEAVRAQRAFLSVIQAICKSERIIIIANPGIVLTSIIKMCMGIIVKRTVNT